MSPGRDGPAAADVACYVVNLRRRADRRTRMQRILPPDLPAVFTSDWATSFDAQHLDPDRLRDGEVRLFPWRIESENPWWSRPLKLGEVGCALAHLACWQHAQAQTHARLVLVLEDDVVLAHNFLDTLLDGIHLLQAGGHLFHLLYLGRDPIAPDTPALSGFVSPGYSHCTYGYLLTRAGLEIVLAAHLEQAIMPVDEFLPALYVHHPRPDVRARFPRQMTALAFSPPLLGQLPKHEAGSDTENSNFVEQP